MVSLPAGWTGRVYGVTSIYAPLGLHDRVGHRWYQDGRLVFASPFYRLEGGRPEGFRLWTCAPATDVRPGTRLTVEVWTEAGQLVGREGYGESRSQNSELRIENSEDRRQKTEDRQRTTSRR